jgi:serpin B
MNLYIKYPNNNEEKIYQFAYFQNIDGLKKKISKEIGKKVDQIKILTNGIERSDWEILKDNAKLEIQYAVEDKPLVTLRPVIKCFEKQYHCSVCDKWYTSVDFFMKCENCPKFHMCQRCFLKYEHIHKMIICEIGMLIGAFSDKQSDISLDFMASMMDNLNFKKKNFVASPHSFQSALAFLGTGSGGKTLKELKDGVRLNIENVDEVDKFMSINDDIVQTSFGLFVDNKIEILDSFAEICKKLKSKVQGFETLNSDYSINVINSYIAEKSKNLLTSTLKYNDLKDAVMVLINVIVFVGKWQYPFEHHLTKNRVFYNGDSTQTKTLFMTTTNHFNFYESKYAKMIELFYVGQQYSMIILKPNNIHTFKWKKAPKYLNNFHQRKISKNIILHLPKFKLFTSQELNDVTRKMGMSSIFTNQLDLSKMVKKNWGFFVSRIFSNVCIEVDEEGTKAAAVTVVLIKETSIPQFDIFIVDSPFIFFLYDNKLNRYLFVGKIYNL